MATAKDQNAALRVACGELRQLLAMQKAAAADRFAVATSSAPAKPETSAPLQQTPRVAWPTSPDTPSSAAASMPKKRHQAVQTEKGPGGREQLADRHKQIAHLRAALAASERQRERQAAAHKRELEALQASLAQVGGASFPLILARNSSAVSFQKASAFMRCSALTIRVMHLPEIIHCIVLNSHGSMYLAIIRN